MIRPININLNAAHPELKLLETVTYTGSPSSVFIRGIPPNYGRWAITAVFVAASFPDGSTTTRAAVQSANGVWVATLPATATSGRTENGFRVIADGIDENGEAATGYIIAVADFAVASLDVTPAPEPGETSYQMLYFDEVPSTLRKGDVTKIDGVLKFYNGSAWEPFAAPVTLDDAVTRTSANGVKSSGIWSAIWGALSALPTGFTSLYDWCVSQLAGKVSKTGDTMTGGLTVPNFTVGSRKSGSIVGTKSVAEGDGTAASGFCSHAEGAYTTATANYSHAEGTYSTADGLCSHAEGTNTTANNDYEHAQGRYNASHKASVTIGDAGNTLSSIGFGTANNNRKNAVETMQDGKTYIYGLGGYDGTNPTSATDIATAVDAKASRAPNPTSGNLAALDAQGNPTDSTIPAADVATKAEFNQALAQANVAYNNAEQANINATDAKATANIADNKATQALETIPYNLVTKTISNNAVTLDDRAINAVAVSSSLASLTVNFPTATSGKARDFGLRLTVASGITTAPELVLPQGVTCENADGEAPEIGADGAATILYFTETASGVFLVKGEVVTAIS